METPKIKIELREKEAKLLSELSDLQKRMGKYNSEEMNKKMFDQLQKSAINSIVTALNISDIWENSSTISSNIQNYNNRKKMSTDDLKGDKFEKTKKKMCEDAGKNNKTGEREHFTDYMTGEELIGGDTSKKGQYAFDHIISADEMKNDLLAGIFMSDEEFRDFLNSDKNIAPLNKGINSELKGAKTWKEFEECLNAPCKKDKTKTNAEYYGIDKKRAFERYKEVRKEYYKIIGLNSLKSIGGYAIKITIFKFTKIIISEIIYECKLKSEESITNRMKKVGRRIISRLSELKDTFKDSVIANFISTLMDIVINFFLNTTKRAFKIIRQIISSILDVFKTLFDNSRPMEERINAALKIISAALVGVSAIILEEAISNALKSIPPLAPFADYISPVLAALITGIGGVLILQLFSKYQSEFEYQKLTQDALIKRGQLNNLEIVESGISEAETAETINASISIFENTCYIVSACEKDINYAIDRIEAGSYKRAKLLANTNENLNEIDKILSLINKQ